MVIWPGPVVGIVFANVMQMEVQAAKNLLLTVVKKVAENEYGSMIKSAFDKGVFKREADASVKAVEQEGLQHKIIPESLRYRRILLIFKNDPLYWATTQLGTFQWANNQMLEIMQVAADWIMRKDDRALGNLRKSYFADIMSDYAALFSIVSTLEVHGATDGFPLETLSQAQYDAVHALHDGECYQNKWSTFADVFDAPKPPKRSFAESESVGIGYDLDQFSHCTVPTRPNTVKDLQDDVVARKALKKFWNH